MIRIDVHTSGTTGVVIATEAPDQAPGAGYDWHAAGTAHVVGQVCRVSRDDEAGLWRAYLWPHPAAYPPRGQHTEAVDAISEDRLEARLRKRLEEKGAWWQ